MGILTVIILLSLSYSVLPTYYFKIFRKKPQSDGGLRLTFDDGPDEEFTPAILDVLYENNVKATFFLVASFAEKCPQIIDRMLAEGHNIGLHSLEHANGFFTSPAYVKRDFEQSMEIFHRHGWPVSIYRAPWGRVNIASLHYINKYKLRYILWNTLVQDWAASSTPQGIYGKILERVKPGYILCLHDGRGENRAPSRTLEALKHALPALKKAGYSFEADIAQAIGEHNG